MAVTYTNGFVNSAATAILNALETDFGKYSPFGDVTFIAGGGQTWDMKNSTQQIYQHHRHITQVW